MCIVLVLLTYVYGNERFQKRKFCKKLPLFSATLHVQTSVWTEIFKQLQRNYLILYTDQIPLHFLINFSIVILPFVPIYSCGLVHTLWKLHEQDYLWFGKKCESASNYILLCVISFLHAVHTSSAYLDLFYSQRSHQSTIRCLACNKLKVPGMQV